MAHLPDSRRRCKTANAAYRLPECRRPQNATPARCVRKMSQSEGRIGNPLKRAQPVTSPRSAQRRNRITSLPNSAAVGRHRGDLRGGPKVGIGDIGAPCPRRETGGCNFEGNTRFRSHDQVAKSTLLAGRGATGKQECDSCEASGADTPIETADITNREHSSWQNTAGRV
jgi:hypothetical protein